MRISGGSCELLLKQPALLLISIVFWMLVYLPGFLTNLTSKVDLPSSVECGHTHAAHTGNHYELVYVDAHTHESILSHLIFPVLFLSCSLKNTWVICYPYLSSTHFLPLFFPLRRLNNTVCGGTQFQAICSVCSRKRALEVVSTVCAVFHYRVGWEKECSYSNPHSFNLSPSHCPLVSLFELPLFTFCFFHMFSSSSFLYLASPSVPVPHFLVFLCVQLWFLNILLVSSGWESYLDFVEEILNLILIHHD